MKLVKPIKEKVSITTVVNGSFWDVLTFILSFGKKGKLFEIIISDGIKWKMPPDNRVNCRCSTHIPFNDKDK